MYRPEIDAIKIELARVDAEIAAARRLLLAGEKGERGLLLYLTDWIGERKMLEREIEKDREQRDANNRDISARFIRENYAPTDRVAVMLINSDGRVVTQIGMAQSFAGDGYLRRLQHMNRNGANVHISLNSLKEYASSRSKDNVLEVKHMYLDFDRQGKAAVNRLMATELPKPEYIINTSPDRYQAVWRTKEFTTAQVETLQKRLARELGADQAATDVARLMRVPGFANTKYSDGPIVTAERRENIAPVTPGDWPKRLLTPERAIVRKIDRTPLADSNERVAPDVLIRKAVDRAGADGSRNAGGFWLAVQARDAGYSRSEAEPMMRQYASRVPDIKGKEPYTEREAMKSLESAYRHPARDPWIPKEPQRGQSLSR